MGHSRIPRSGAAAQALPSTWCWTIVHAIVAAALGLFLFVPGAEQCLGETSRQPHAIPDFQELLQKMADLSPDPCGAPFGREKDWHSADVEYHLFQRAAETVTQALNAATDSPGSSLERAREALKKLEGMSAGINAAWPEENRFHFQILDVRPLLVVKMTMRTDGRYFMFGVPEENSSAKPNHLWQEVGSDDEFPEHYPATYSLELFALHRGPSGKARFLAKLEYSGCAGSIGVAYGAREWNPKGFGDLEQAIKQAGASGLDDKVPDFPQIGELRTEGSLITLPYCSFSAIDTWDNPSLCTVDTYDLSGDKVRFRSRVYNRPDLVPVANAIKYAEERDFPLC